jgi:hypothetical protein
VLASEVVKVAEAAGARQGFADMLGLGDMSEEFCDYGDAPRRVGRTGEMCGDRLEELVQVSEQQVNFVAVVSVKGGAADVCAVEHVLHADLAERLLLHERSQRRC